MRIMLVAPYFPPEVTGSSNFVSDLAIGLSELGHTVCVVTATSANSHELFTVISLKARHFKPGKIAFNYSIPVICTLRNKRALVNLFETFQPDVVSSHGQIFDITLLANYLARKRKIPTLMTVHSAIWHDKRYLNAILALGDTLLSHILLRRICSAWIAVDNRTLKHITKRYSKSAKIIPICIRKGVFANGNRETACNKYKIHGTPVIASIGHVVPVRNRVALVESLPNLIGQFPNLEIVIVGRVADASFIKRAEELGVDKYLNVLGAVPHSNISNILAASNLEVHDIQGFGLGIGSLEPIDAGVPIIAFIGESNLEEFNYREICPEGFIDRNDAETLAVAIARALTDANFRQKLVDGQKKLLEEVYYLDVIANRYAQEFAKYINN